MRGEDGHIHASSGQNVLGPPADGISRSRAKGVTCSEEKLSCVLSMKGCTANVVRQCCDNAKSSVRGVGPETNLVQMSVRPGGFDQVTNSECSRGGGECHVTDVQKHERLTSLAGKQET